MYFTSIIFLSGPFKKSPKPPNLKQEFNLCFFHCRVCIFREHLQQDIKVDVYNSLVRIGLPRIESRLKISHGFIGNDIIRQKCFLLQAKLLST